MHFPFLNIVCPILLLDLCSRDVPTRMLGRINAYKRLLIGCVSVETQICMHVAKGAPHDSSSSRTCQVPLAEPVSSVGLHAVERGGG